jgi:hypothetical protein
MKLSHPIPRIAVAGCAALVAATAAPAAQAADSPPVRAAIARAGLTDGPGRLERVSTRAPAPPPGARPVRMLRYRQTLEGLRVLWSRIDVAVARGEVLSVDATVLPLRGGAPASRAAVGRARALRLAARAVPGRAARAESVIYAGRPGAPARPRRAYVVAVVSRAAPASTVSVVLDAASGRVLDRFAGDAAAPLPPHRSPRARASASSTVLFQIANFARQPSGNGYPYGKTDRTVSTSGTGYSWDLPGSTTQQYDGYDAALNLMAGNALETGRFFCIYRNYCGRDGGQPGASGNGDFNRLFLVGNWNLNGDSDDSRYSATDDHILIGAADRMDGDVFAHEFGHLIDRHLRDDYLASFQSREVTEALADMFFIDAQDTSIYWDGNPGGGGLFVDFASHSPGLLKGPHDMAHYSCTTTDEHDNGAMLTHAYWQLTQSIGHSAAGWLLQYVPWALPAERTFGSVRKAFRQTAANLYGPGSPTVAAVNSAFDHIGVSESTRRTCAPPPPPEWPPPICDIKPTLPQCDAPPIIPPPAAGDPS